jgi:hypothetical protein
MSRVELLCRTHINQQRVAAGNSGLQIRRRDSREAPALRAILIQGSLGLGQLVHGHAAQLCPEAGHRRVGQAVADRRTVAIADDEASPLQPLEML